ncbi:MAG: hypothetical protein ACK5MG_06465 [Bacteroidales bacterium]
MSQNVEVILGKGTNALSFGMTTKEVISILGKADEIENMCLEEDSDEQSEVWHYDDLGLTLTFDDIDTWVLTSISSSAQTTTLNNTSLIGMSEDDIMKLIEDKILAVNEGIEVFENFADDIPDAKMISCPDNEISFWLDADGVIEVQWGVLFESDEETIKWPS